MAVDATIALITLAQAKTFLKVTASSEDSLLGDLINSMSYAAKSYCGVNFVQANYTEYYDGDGCLDHLILRNAPLISVASMYDDLQRLFTSASLISTDDYQLELGAGIVRLWNNRGRFSNGKGNIKITYSAGYASIPYDLQHAALLMVLHAYKRHYQDQRIGLVSETIGDRNMTYANEDIPKSAKSILDKYRNLGAATRGY